AKHAPPEQLEHPLHAWRALTDPAVRTPAQFAARRRQLVEGRKARAAEGAKRSTTFADFRAGYRGGFVTGHAFGDGPSRAEAVLDPSAPVPVQRLVRPGVAHSGLVSGRLQGALRSKTFTIEKKYILYRASGRGVRVNLIIDGYQQIR